MPTSKLTKAILLNIFIIPGAGEIIIFKQKLRGFILIAVALTLVLAFFLHFTALIQAQLMGLNPPDQDFNQMYKVAEIISRGVMAHNWPTIKYYLYGLVICYFTGIADVVLLYSKSRAKIN